jgi:hypothetical protein
LSGKASPLSVSITPAKQTLASGVTHATKVIKVSNYGKAPITVTSNEMTLHQAAGGCGVGQSNGWLAFSPSSFSLAPGQSQPVHVTVSAPAGAPTTDVLAVFTASGHAATTAHSGGSVAGAVASQIVIAGQSGSAPKCGHQAQASPPSSGGLSSFDMAFGVLALVFVALVAALVVTGRNRGRRRAA